MPPPPGPPRVHCLRRADVLRPEPHETILDAARRHDVPLASSCAGRAVCGDCLVRIVAADGDLPPPDAEETAWRLRKRYTGAARLACRLTPTADCTISTTYW